jgi:hypothetical protein
MRILTHRTFACFKTAWLILPLCLLIVPLACETRESPPTADSEDVRLLLRTEVAASFHLLSDVERLEVRLRRWAQGRAYEKLALAEGLLESMITDEQPGTLDKYTWKPGTNDLSTAAGRANWALEGLLRVKLPVVLGRGATQEEVERAHAMASSTVEAYRQGIIALNTEKEIPPEKLRRLRREYKDKIDAEKWEVAAESAAWMDELLGEWPPIGRKYEDLAFIIGEEPKEKLWYPKGTLVYRFQGNVHGADFYLRVKDGVIVSMGRSCP